MAKQAAATRKKFEFDAAGWLFWIIMFFVLLGPSLFGVWKMVDKDTEVSIRVGSAIVFAALGAGLVSWAVNSILQRRKKKERLAQRKQAKKQK